MDLVRLVGRVERHRDGAEPQNAEIRRDPARVIVGQDGAAIAAERLPNIAVRATNRLGASPSNWPRLTDPITLTSNGLLRMTNVFSAGQPRMFYITTEQP